MPRLIDYPLVLRGLQSLGLRCLYHNSGAFGFDPPAASCTVAWIGAPDPTIRREALRFVRTVPLPFRDNASRAAALVWRTIGGPIWLMPKSHWAYELEFGNADWLPSVLRDAGIDSAPLIHCNQAPAVEFLADEIEVFREVLAQFLQRLQNSDFALVFPDHPVYATIHHHRQLWWTSPDADLIARLSALGGGQSEPPQI